MAALDLEQSFRKAYHQRYGKQIRDLRRTEAGDYLINGIQFNTSQVEAMLSTLQQELAKQNKGLVRRLISFFGGKKPS